MENDLDFGLSLLAAFAYYDRSTSSWRTCRRSLRGDWVAYSGTWPRAGTTRSGTAFLQSPLVPLTDVTGCSSLPTPKASDGERGGRGELLAVVLCFPTPTVAMHKGSSLNSMSRKTGASRLNDRLDYSVEQGQIELGRLNPTWVEWLMGFPIGWTDLKDSETPSSLK